MQSSLDIWPVEVGFHLQIHAGIVLGDAIRSGLGPCSAEVQPY